MSVKVRSEILGDRNEEEMSFPGDDDFDDFDDFDDEDRSLLEEMDFRDPGGKSALRKGPRIFPCPTCKQPNKLTGRDVELGYQCDDCADLDEQGW